MWSLCMFMTIYDIEIFLTHAVHQIKFSHTCIHMRETFEMKGQNIFLFYEKNDDDLKIDEKLVRLYMNRFIIEEDHQNDIVGVAPLTEISKMNFQIAPRFHDLPDYFQQYLFFDIYTQWKALKEIKLMQDVSIIHSVIQQNFHWPEEFEAV